MIIGDDKREKVRAQIVTTQREPWFTPNIGDSDQFMDPNFSISQIFFSKQTASSLVDALDTYSEPCCLCTPRLAEEWFRRGRKVMLLDVDKRFAAFSEFIFFDILYPRSMDNSFDVLIVDSPAFDPEWVHATVNLLTKGRTIDLFAVFRDDQADQVLRVFREYAIRPTDFRLVYCNVQPEYQSTFRLYGTRPDIFAVGARS